MSELDNAVRHMAETLSTSEGATSSMTCAEVDSIVYVMALGGHRSAAMNVIIGHAFGDGGRPSEEDGDAHFFIVDEHEEAGIGGIGNADDLRRAGEYVDRLLGL